MKESGLHGIWLMQREPTNTAEIIHILRDSGRLLSWALQGKSSRREKKSSLLVSAVVLSTYVHSNACWSAWLRFFWKAKHLSREYCMQRLIKWGQVIWKKLKNCYFVSCLKTWDQEHSFCWVFVFWEIVLKSWWHTLGRFELQLLIPGALCYSFQKLDEMTLKTFVSPRSHRFE